MTDEIQIMNWWQINFLKLWCTPLKLTVTYTLLNMSVSAKGFWTFISCIKDYSSKIFNIRADCCLKVKYETHLHPIITLHCTVDKKKLSNIEFMVFYYRAVIHIIWSYLSSALECVQSTGFRHHMYIWSIFKQDELFIVECYLENV